MLNILCLYIDLHFTFLYAENNVRLCLNIINLLFLEKKSVSNITSCMFKKLRNESCFFLIIKRNEPYPPF